MTVYEFTLTDGSPLTQILSYESNGVGNVSTPHAIAGVHVSNSDYHYFIVDGNYAQRFVAGFEFDITGGTSYDGHYVVAKDSKCMSGQTFVPVDEIPTPPPAYPPTGSVVHNAPDQRAYITYSVANPASSLKLLGHGTTHFNPDSTWGAAIQQNLVAMLENFASTEAPSNPLIGQLWYDKTTNLLRVHAEAGWKPIIDLEAWVNQLTTMFVKIGDAIELSSQPTQPNHAATKRYVDAYVNGVIWKTPILDPNLFDDSLSTPPDLSNEPAYNKTFIVQQGQGEWAQFTGHAVQFTGSAWVSVLGRPVQAGDRFGVFIEPDDQYLAEQPGGGLTDRAGQIATIASVSPLTYTFETPVEPDAIAVVKTRAGGSYFVGRGYTFRGMYGEGSHGQDFRWIEFVFAPPSERRVERPQFSMSPGEPGDMHVDDNYLYVYGTTGWRRLPLQTF